MPLGAHKVTLLGVAGVADSGTAVLLSTATASNDASIEFTLPTAYKQVKFGFYNVTPVTDAAELQFDFSISGSYGSATKTTTFFRAYHHESGSGAAITYRTASDLAQSTSAQHFAYSVGADADQSAAGELVLYNPASTTYVKHFYGRAAFSIDSDYAIDAYTGGYCNTTSVLDGIKFLMSSGNISSGTIKMWGVR